MIEPRPARCMCGITALQHRYTEVRLTSCTRHQASIPVTRMESSSGGEMPALLNATSTPAVGLDGRREQGVDLLLRRDVGAHEQPVHLVGGGLPGRGVDVGDHHPGALGGQPAGGGQPDPAAAAGDHRGAAVEACVVPILPCSSSCAGGRHQRA